MDGPAHFNPDGPRLMELPMEYFCFDRVAAADVPKGPGEGIVPEDLKLWEEAIRAADLLLLKTGLCKIRDTQPRVYEAQGAFLTPEVCRYLVETFPDLKAIGLDFLSVGDARQPAVQTGSPHPVRMPQREVHPGHRGHGPASAV